MSFLGTVLPPCMVWLVLRRLTDELRVMARRTPHRSAEPARADGVPGDAFPLAHGGQRAPADRGHRPLQAHQRHPRPPDGRPGSGRVAQVLQATARKGDLICRLGARNSWSWPWTSNPPESSCWPSACARRSATAKCPASLPRSHPVHRHHRGIGKLLAPAGAGCGAAAGRRGAVPGKASGRDRVESAFATPRCPPEAHAAAVPPSKYNRGQ